MFWKSGQTPQILLISNQYPADLPAMQVVHCTLEADKLILLEAEIYQSESFCCSQQ